MEHAKLRGVVALLKTAQESVEVPRGWDRHAAHVHVGLGAVQAVCAAARDGEQQGVFAQVKVHFPRYRRTPGIANPHPFDCNS